MKERIIGWFLVGAILGVWIGLGITSARADTKKLCVDNDAGGKVVITNQPCNLNIPFDTGHKMYQAYATEKEGARHKGCWFGGEDGIHIFYEEFFKERLVASFNPAIFKPCEDSF